MYQSCPGFIQLPPRPVTVGRYVLGHVNRQGELVLIEPATVYVDGDLDELWAWATALGQKIFLITPYVGANHVDD